MISVHALIDGNMHLLAASSSGECDLFDLAILVIETLHGYFKYKTAY